MMPGVGAGAGPLVNGVALTGVVDTCLGGGLLGICAEGKMVTLSGNAVGVSLGTLGEGAGKSGWKATAGAGCGAVGAGAVGGIVVTVGLDDVRSWRWVRPPCTWCVSDWGGGHRFGWGIFGYMC